MKKLFAISLVFATTTMLIATVQAEVTVKYSRGTLTLRGDANADSVEIFGVAPNEVSLSINGDGPDCYENVQNIRVDMGRGTDFISVQDVQISGKLDINMGANLDDEAEVINSQIGGNLTVKGAADARIADSDVGRNMTLTTGLPNDLDGDGFTLSVQGGYVANRASINGSNRSIDVVSITEVFFASDLSVGLGGGADALFMTDNFVGRNLTVDGGAGTDFTQSQGNLIGGRITLRRFELFF